MLTHWPFCISVHVLCLVSWVAAGAGIGTGIGAGIGAGCKDRGWDRDWYRGWDRGRDRGWDRGWDHTTGLSLGNKSQVHFPALFAFFLIFFCIF